MLEPGRLDGHYHDFSVSKTDYLYLFPGLYNPLLAFLFVGVFGRDGGNRVPSLSVYEHPAQRLSPDRLHDVSYLPDHPLDTGRCWPLSGRERFARACYENSPHEKGESYEDCEHRPRVSGRYAEERQGSQDECHHRRDGRQPVIKRH